MIGGVEMRLGTRVTFRAGLLWAMGLFVVAYAAGLVLQGDVSNPIVDVWLALLTVWVPAAVCWLAVTRAGLRHWEVPLVAIAVTTYAGGNTYYITMLGEAGSLPFPSLGDAGYLGFFPPMLAALVVVVRHGARELAWSAWLDCAVGSLGAAAVLAVLLSPVLDSAMSGSLSLATVLSVAYPLCDMLVVAAVAGVIAVGATRGGSLVVVGLVVFAAGDVIYALQVTADTYVIGTPLDATWAFGLALVALWVDRGPRHEISTRKQTHLATGAVALAVSSIATAAGLGVLIVGTQVNLSKLAVALAGVTLLAAAARSQLAFRLLARMAELRRTTAITDELTGLPNRRALYGEGRARLAQPHHGRQALLMLDLNKFKEVNDSLGHHAGDLLLIEVASRLSAQLSPDSLLTRLMNRA